MPIEVARLSISNMELVPLGVERHSWKVFMRVALLVSAVIVGGALFACANGTDASATGDDGTGTGGGTDSGGVSTLPPDGYDAGPSNPYAKTPDASIDAAAIKTKDSGGGGGGMDSGGGGGGNTDCTGTQGSQLMLSYDKECSNYFVSTLGMSNNCTPGGSDCAPLSDGTVMCCFQPKSASKCDIYYSSTPQCVPK